MSAYDDEPRVDPYELVERFWPYDGPYSGELTTDAALMIGRLGRYLNNATQKHDALPYAATSGRVLADLASAVAGYDQLLAHLARYLDRQAETNPSLYDDRRDRQGPDTARACVARLRSARPSLVALSDVLAEAATLADHLGSA